MNISFEELLQKNKNNTLNIIDVRDEYSYSKSHIIGAKNIPAQKLIYNPDSYLDHQETYYIYCKSGSTSQKIVENLNKRGYHTFNVTGGFNNYLLWK